MPMKYPLPKCEQIQYMKIATAENSCATVLYVQTCSGKYDRCANLAKFFSDVSLIIHQSVSVHWCAVCCVVQIIAAVVDPLIQMCSLSASRLSTIDMATYMVNCLHLIHTTIALYEFTEQRLEILQAQV